MMKNRIKDPFDMSASDRTLQTVAIPPGWSPASWRSFAATQQPAYPDAEALAGVQRELGVLPPLVTSWEILALKKQLEAPPRARERPLTPRRLEESSSPRVKPVPEAYPIGRQPRCARGAVAERFMYPLSWLYREADDAGMHVSVAEPVHQRAEEGRSGQSAWRSSCRQGYC